MEDDDDVEKCDDVTTCSIMTTCDILLLTKGDITLLKFLTP